MKKPPPVKQKVSNVGVSALARECGVSTATISNRMKRGQTADQIRREYARRAGQPHKGPGRPPGSKASGPGRAPASPSEYDMVVAARSRYDEMEGWKLRRQKALAERQEIENMLRRGELVPLAYARKWMTRYLTDGRDELLKGPSELADQLAAESDPVKTAEIIRAWLERVMAKFEQLRTIWDGNLQDEQVA